MNGEAERERRSLLRWRRVTRALQVGLALSVAAGVWIVGFAPGSDAVPVVPNTETQFSLDLEVVGSAEHSLVYAVEQRARPYYRIFSFNPATGSVKTIFTVPEDAIIYGIALNPAGDTLAVAYSPDYTLDGSGIWMLDLATGQIVEMTPVEAQVYLTDLAWSTDGVSVLATHVDRRGEQEQLSVARVDSTSGLVESMVADAINPVPLGDTVYYLTVDAEQARRSIGSVDVTGTTATVEVGDGGNDLDHLLAGKSDTALRVAVLESADGGLSIGEPAAAHGNHNVASTWWDIAVDEASGSAALGLPATIVYDAAASGDNIVYATGEGLVIGNGSQTDVIKSRAIRFVAA